MRQSPHRHRRLVGVIIATLLVAGATGYWLVTSTPLAHAVGFMAKPSATQAVASAMALDQAQPPAEPTPEAPPTPTATATAATPTPEPTPTVAPPAPAAPAADPSKVIYLTYDDGPDPTWTPAILDTLAQYGAKATFFAQGERVSAYGALAARAYAEGHGVQNHSWNHRNFTTLSRSSIINQQISRTNDVIAETIGVAPKCVRPPYGATNATAREAIAATGLQTQMWTIDTLDYTLPGAQSIANKVISQAKPGAIVLMHDAGGSSRQQTVTATQTILERLSERGYTFAPLCR